MAEPAPAARPTPKRLAKLTKDRLADAVALHEATTAGTHVELTADAVARIAKLARAAHAPEDAVARLAADPRVTAIRRDADVYVMTLGLLSDAATLWVSVHVIDKELRYRLCEGDGAAAARPAKAHDGVPPDERLDRARARLTPRRPAVRDFSSTRLWDSVHQVARHADDLARRRTREVLIASTPGTALADPRLINRTVRVQLRTASADERAIAHIVRAVPARADKPAIAAIMRGFGEPDRDAQDQTSAPHEPTLYISLELEKRRWAEQVEGFAAAIHAVLAVRPDIARILVNGMTAPFDGTKSDIAPAVRAEEMRLIAALGGAIGARVPIVSLFGQTLAAKFEACRGAVYFLAPIGSASLVPNLLGVPGVSYGLPARYGFADWLDNNGVRRLPLDWVDERADVDGIVDQGRPRPTTKSYSIDPAAFGRFVAVHLRDVSLAGRAAAPATPARPIEPIGSGDLMEAMRAVDHFTRRPGKVAVDDTHAEAVKSLMVRAGVPDPVTTALFARGRPAIVRRDRGHCITLLVGAGARSGPIAAVEYHWRDDTAAWCIAGDGEPAASRPDAAGLSAVIRAFAVKDLAADRALPVVHGFLQQRPFEALRHGVRLACEIVADGWPALPTSVKPDATMLDPRLLGERLNVVVQTMPEGRTRRMHLVRSSGRDIPREAIHALGPKLFGPHRPRADTVFVSLEVEKRGFATQVAAYAAMLNALAAHEPRLTTVLVNGMTAPFDGAPPDFYGSVAEAERALMAEIAANLHRPLGFVPLFGRTLARKARAIADASFMVAPFGGPSLLASLIGVPGITFGNAIRQSEDLALDNAQIVRLPAEHVRPSSEVRGLIRYGATGGARIEGYTIDPAVFADVALTHFKATR